MPAPVIYCLCTEGISTYVCVQRRADRSPVILKESLSVKCLTFELFWPGIFLNCIPINERLRPETRAVSGLAYLPQSCERADQDFCGQCWS